MFRKHILSFTLCCFASAASTEPTSLVGSTQCSSQYKSGWIDLSAPINLNQGDVLSVAVVGNAEAVLVRLADKTFCSLSNPCGYITQSKFPVDGIVTVTLPVNYKNVDHISVHGSAPWGNALLGRDGTPIIDNGPACLSSVWLN